MAQNIYDDEGFFEAYAKLPRSMGGLDAAPEWPSLRGLLPDLRGARVVDLGCGYGWFCRWAADAGAASVRGIDLSERMLERARADTRDERITYECHDLDRLALAGGPYDLAYSSLTVHYLLDLDRFFTTVGQAMCPGGVFVFSAEHPIATAPTNPEFVADADGRVTWPLDGYLAEGPRTTDWLAPGVVKQHRTIASHVSALRQAGFDLTDLIEWGPSTDDLAEHPEWAAEIERPPFLLVGGRRRR